MQPLSSSVRIGVLRGGPSPEYEVSLKTGANVLKNLGDTHRPIDVFISKDGKWHMNGIEKSPERILKNIDVVFNALHGTYGEDGQVQEILSSHGVPFTGSLKYASSVAMNKWITKERAILAGIKTPLSILVRQTDSLPVKAREIFNTIPHPLVVKPACGGSSVSFQKADSYSELLTALEQTLTLHGSAVVEEFIAGKEATCGVIDNFRGEGLYSLPPVEVVSSEGKSAEICPGNFTEKEKKEIERVAKMIHNKLGLRHYSRSDFVVSPRRGVYFLETNTLPELTEDSRISKSLKAVGIEVKEFLHHILNLAIHKTGVWI